MILLTAMGNFTTNAHTIINTGVNLAPFAVLCIILLLAVAGLLLVIRKVVKIILLKLGYTKEDAEKYSNFKL